MEQQYKISQSELEKLLEAQQLLQALQSLGVDNWHGYSEVDWEEAENVDLSDYEKV